MVIFSLAVLALVAQYPVALAARYHLTDNWQGSSFWDNFEFQAIDDPTHGRVEYGALPYDFWPLSLTRCLRVGTWTAPMPSV
jgi:hypothetical protein